MSRGQAPQVAFQIKECHSCFEQLRLRKTILRSQFWYLCDVVSLNALRLRLNMLSLGSGNRALLIRFETFETVGLKPKVGKRV